MSGIKSMNRINKFLSVFAVFFVAAVVGVYLTANSSGAYERQVERSDSSEAKSENRRRPPKQAINPEREHRHEKRIPEYFEVAPENDDLPPVLNPESFAGRAREAYRAASEIPQTIAQLPCFCYCDESSGHQSLHSCFEDEHGSLCRICIEEAITAYRLQKEEDLSPEEIRDHIIAKYAK